MGRPAPSDLDEGSPRGPRSSSAWGVVAPVLAVLALVGIVTVAATGSTPSGSGRSTSPADSLLDTVVSLVLVLFVVGFAVVVYALVHWKEHEWTAPRRRNDLRALATMLAVAFALALVLRERGLSFTFNPEQAPFDRGESSAPPPGFGEGSEPGYEFEFAWLPVLVVTVLAAVGVAAFVLSARRARSSRADAALAADLALALDLTLDDLRAEVDPRRAVIAAYARLERVLAAHGQPRLVADTPEEHLARALTQLDVERHAIRRLADLFVRAKFSQHEVDLGMKEEAIGALEHVRDALRAAEAQEEESPAPGGVPA